MNWSTELKEELKAGMQPLVPTPAYSQDDVIDFMLQEYGKATVLRAGGIPDNMEWAPESIPTTIGSVSTGVLQAEELVSVISFNEAWYPAVQKLFAYTRDHAREICDAYKDNPSEWSKAIQKDAQEFWGETTE